MAFRTLKTGLILCVVAVVFLWWRKAHDRDVAISLSVQPGEIRLDGTVHSIDSQKKTFVVKAESFTLPNRKKRALPRPRNKSVRTTSETTFHATANEAGRSFRQLKVGHRVVTIGKDLGSGKELPARLVYLGGMTSFAIPSADRKPDKIWTENAAGIPVRVISVDLTDPRVRVTVQLARNFPWAPESFPSMLSRSKPTAAIDGAYFSKSTYEPIGDIVKDGIEYHSGRMGTAMAITKDRKVSMVRVRWGRHVNWQGYETVLACGPALVLQDRISVYPEYEGFRDPHIMGSTRRMGVGVTSNNRLLLVTTLRPVTFRKWAQVMKALKCRQAMNLDAGASLGMYYRGAMYERPSRYLTNLLVVRVENKSLASPSHKTRGSSKGHMQALKKWIKNLLP